MTSPCVQPVDIANRLELFIDDHLIDRFEGQTALKLHKPEPREVVFTTDQRPQARRRIPRPRKAPAATYATA